ncbi:MAG: DUF1501 domain-containing protein [Planctomycetaceae bacterium]|nr:DUF1501 domain-containing protein [Planctomycetales bacterium]MCB9873022.1 DUF1501 domain-containing protein [Planctomycetaceae bacterium]MCB9937015.1 DUF1501 domain-containing protein [Planctomycetaceae bacterium]
MNGDKTQQENAILASTRRQFFERCGVGVGSMALASLFAQEQAGAKPVVTNPMAPRQPHYKPKAKSVIFMFMAGGPSQLDLFNDKPMLREHHGQLPPQSYLEGKRFAFLKGTETLLASPQKFGRYGECGQELSDLLPHHREIVDEVCWLHGMKTDVFNHGPAKIFVNTGSPQPGRPSMGSWVTYGLGSEASDLPGFVVLQSGPRGPRAGSSLWSSGFLPTTYQGVPFRSGPEPILNLTSPAGMTRERERRFVDMVSDLNRLRLDQVGDAEIATRIAAYEMAYEMQSSAPELMELSDEPQSTLDMYGATPGKPSYANNCLLARRLVERGVRFVQLYHTNWDHHGGPTENLEVHLPAICKEIDQASAALVRDLKQRGLLDDTIVIWGGEFGRTPMGEVRDNTGRDHHIDAYSMWAAGGGFKPGLIHGKTDELGLGSVEDGKHVHDLQATILHLLGFNHERLTYRFQGRDFRLTDVHGEILHDVIG